MERQAILRACRALAAEEPPALATLARAAGLSRFHFLRVFKARVGVTPKAYAAEKRAERARRALRRGARVTEAAYEAGYGSGGRFHADSRRALGMEPRRYRAGGAGETIRFATGACLLGRVLVASSSRGVCAILLGRDARALEADLRRRFPNARVAAGGSGYARALAAAVRLVEEPSEGLSLPLDVRGTAFQRRVWDALRRIPSGSTASYAEVARRLGRPRAARAVAAACAANRIAVAIPCHRVTRGDGALSGYRWGVARKRALLARERT